MRRLICWTCTLQSTLPSICSRCIISFDGAMGDNTIEMCVRVCVFVHEKGLCGRREIRRVEVRAYLYTYIYILGTLENYNNNAITIHNVPL